MKLLEAERTLAPPRDADAPPTLPAEPQAPAEPVAPARTCATCGAAMEGEQDWCLQCGTAASGRLGDRAGWRSALAVAGLTLALVAGAVAAAYAAMSGDAAREASGPVAAAGAPVAAPTPGVPAAEAPPVEPVPAGDLPSVSPGTGAAADAPAAEPVEPVTPATPTPTTPAPAAQKPEGGGEPTTTTPAPEPAKAIALAEGAGDLYDPLGRAGTASPVSDPARAVDGDRATSWAVTSSNPLQPGVGYVVDVGEARGIREVKLRTSTPGFKVEVYATDEATAPPEITDTRWAHIRDRSDVEETQRIVLGGGTTPYRQILLWFTEPPADGARIRLTELRLLG